MTGVTRLRLWLCRHIAAHSWEGGQCKRCGEPYGPHEVPPPGYGIDS